MVTSITTVSVHSGTSACRTFRYEGADSGQHSLACHYNDNNNFSVFGSRSLCHRCNCVCGWMISALLLSYVTLFCLLRNTALVSFIHCFDILSENLCQQPLKWKKKWIKWRGIPKLLTGSLCRLCLCFSFLFLFYCSVPSSTCTVVSAHTEVTLSWTVNSSLWWLFVFV